MLSVQSPSAGRLEHTSSPSRSPLVPFMVADRGASSVQLTTPVTTSFAACVYGAAQRAGAKTTTTRPKRLVVRS